MKSAFAGIITTLLTTPSLYLGVNAKGGVRSDAQNHAVEAERLMTEVVSLQTGEMTLTTNDIKILAEEENASLNEENVKLNTGVTVSLDERKAYETQTLTSCVGDRNTFDAGYGGCTTYTINNNYSHCYEDTNDDGERASQVCSECRQCSDSRILPDDNIVRKNVVEHVFSRARILNPPENRRSYSSVWSNDPIGTGHAQSKIDSPQTWCASSKRINDYMVIDLGKEVTITGIATQGRHDQSYGNQSVTKIGVQFSSNRRTYTRMDIFDTPTMGVDVVTFTKLTQRVTTRYVKITVKAFYIHPSMRAGVVLPGERN